MLVNFYKNYNYHIYNNQSYYGIKKNNKQSGIKHQMPSFRGEGSDDSFYTDWEKRMAKKYMYAKNFEELICEEFLNDDDVDYGSWPDNAIELINTYRSQNQNYRNQSKDAENRISDFQASSKKLEAENAKLTQELININRLRVLEQIKLDRVLASEKRKLQAFKELDTKYIALFDLEEKSFPNGIMIKGMDNPDEQLSVLDYLKRKKCQVLRLDFNRLPLNTVHKDIDNCAKRVKESNIHSIICIENFGRYTVDNDENFDFISKIKQFLTSCSRKYDTTVLVFESNPNRLDENVISRHRFQKVIDVSDIEKKDFSRFVPKYDGYTLIYDNDTKENVDLYLANFGYNDKTLWINSNDAKQIIEVMKRLDEIKKLRRFKNIRYIQAPQPENLLALKGFYPCRECTEDFKQIYQYTIDN